MIVALLLFCALLALCFSLICAGIAASLRQIATSAEREAIATETNVRLAREVNEMQQELLKMTREGNAAIQRASQAGMN